MYAHAHKRTPMHPQMLVFFSLCPPKETKRTKKFLFCARFSQEKKKKEIQNHKKKRKKWSVNNGKRELNRGLQVKG